MNMTGDPFDAHGLDYDDSDEGADENGNPVTSLGGSEIVIWFWKLRTKLRTRGPMIR